MSITSGRYIITHAQYWNLAFLSDGNDGTSLLGCVEQDVPGEEWNVKDLRNGRYSILNFGHKMSASAGFYDRKGEHVVGRNTDCIWLIKEHNLGGTYTISTADDKLRWWLDSTWPATPALLVPGKITLHDGPPSDPRCQWTFQKIGRMNTTPYEAVKREAAAAEVAQAKAMAAENAARREEAEVEVEEAKQEMAIILEELQEAKQEAAHAKEEVARILAELEAARQETAAAKAVATKDAARREVAEVEVAEKEVARILEELQEAKHEAAQAEAEASIKAKEVEVAKREAAQTKAEVVKFLRAAREETATAKAGAAEEAAKREAAQVEASKNAAELEVAKEEAAVARATATEHAAKRKEAELEASRRATELEKAKREAALAEREVVRKSTELEAAKAEVAVARASAAEHAAKRKEAELEASRMAAELEQAKGRAARAKQDKSSEQDDGCRTLESSMANHPSLNVTTELEVYPPFATGGRVDVHSGRCRQKKVFVKNLRSHEGWGVNPHAGASSEPHITTEMPKWAALKHQNVCEFFGYSTRFGPYPALVYAWCDGDTVFEYLRDRYLRVRKRIRLAQDVAEGLQYLHENGIVHGDLTLKNILVDDSGVAQLCDFGLAQLAEWQQPIVLTVASNYSGRDRYSAPELSSGPTSVATFESDVYSLGCILLKFIEELNPFDGVQDVAKQKRKTPPAPPARRKDKTGVLSGMTLFFWNWLEACWEEPETRPKTYKIVEILQTLASNFPLTQPEQVESPALHPAPASEPLDQTTLNYGPSFSIPAHPPVEATFSVGSARDLLTGRAIPTRRSPLRTEGSAGLPSFGQTTDASVYTHGSRGAVYQPSNAFLHNQGSRTGGYELPERQFDAAGGSVMTRGEPPESRNPTVAPRPSFARNRPPFEGSDPTRPSSSPGTRGPAPAESLLAVPAREPASATMEGGDRGGKAHEIVENLQTIASSVPLRQPEQLGSAPSYPTPAPESVDKPTFNYGPSGSIPAQPPIEFPFPFGDLLTGRPHPTPRLSPRTEGSGEVRRQLRRFFPTTRNKPAPESDV